MKNKLLQFQNLGEIAYNNAWTYQEKLYNSIVEIKLNNRKLFPENQQLTPNFLLFCEHKHVYTLGKNGLLNHLLLQNEKLKAKGIDFFKINRGGDITYHGPGQIVGYPIIDLANFTQDLGKYLRALESVIISTIAHYGIKGYRIDGATGVWVGTEKPRKICAMGIRASRWVTMHGWALNVNTDLSFFNHIVPCGISDKGVTSIEKEVGAKVEKLEVQELLKKYFAQHLEFEYIE